MKITVDPTELMTLAVTMGTSAVELADIGTSLQSCVGCAMPPDIRNLVDQIVATTDTILDTSAVTLRTEAGDLAQRALIATNDSLAAASLATTPTNMSVIGGNQTPAFTITNPDGSPADPTPSTATIGGNSFAGGTLSLSQSIFPGGPNVGMFGVGSDGVLGLDDIQGQASLNSLQRRSISPPGSVVGSWTSSSMDIQLVNPDGSSAGPASRLSEMLQSARGGQRPRASTLSQSETAWAMGPLMNMMRNDINYNVFAAHQNFMGITPPPQHQSQFRNLPF